MLKKSEIIDDFVRKLEETHPDLYRYYDKELFYADIRKLKENNLSLIQLKVELAKILAKLKDAHTSIFFNKNTIVQLRKLGNDIYIIDDYKNINSNYKYKKITHINGFEIDYVINKVQECFPNETNSFSDYLLEENLLSEEILKGLNIATDNIIITLEDGTIIDYNEELRKDYIKDIKYFKNKVLDNDIYYIKYGTCNNLGNSNIEEWFNSIIYELSNSNFKKFIIDLRGNTGGRSKYFSNFVEKLKGYSNSMSFVTLVDRGVFSSGVFALNDMISLDSYIIGEKVGTTKNHFGYVTQLKLFDFSIGCSNSEWLLENNKYIRYKKNEIPPEKIKQRNEFEVDELIEEDINYYINEEDPYINKAVEYLNSKINKFVN